MRFATRWQAAGAVAVLCACAAPPPAPGGADSPSPRGATAGEMARLGATLHGRSGTDVEAALGPATRIRFDSGHEVWVYRFVEAAPRPDARVRSGVGGQRVDAGEDASSELVLLLTPAGTVARSRVRSPSP